MSRAKKPTDRVYELITDDGEVRACDAITEESCKETPNNFFKNIFSGALSKLAEQLVSPGTTLPWILSALGVPYGFSGALVPIKDGGSLLPQLMVSAKIRKYPKRKWFWVVPSLLQGLCLVLMAFVVLYLDKALAGWLILLLLLIYSIFSGVASISFKDVTAKTIPKGKRGQMLALRSTIGGILTLAAGIWILADLENEGDSPLLFWLVLAGGVLWMLSALVFSSIFEMDGATEGGRSPIEEVKNAWSFWKKDANLRYFIITRGLLMAIPLAQPFFIIIGREEIGEEINNLGIMVMATGLAGIISSPFWGRFADHSSKRMMLFVAVMGMVNISLMALFPFWPDDFKNIYTFSLLLLVQVMAHGGARLSRKTYLIDFAPEKDRPLYVSLSNTAIGVFTLVGAGLGTIAGLFGIQELLWVFTGLLGISLIIGSKLKET